jgi:hypothetical protein
MRQNLIYNKPDLYTMKNDEITHIFASKVDPETLHKYMEVSFPLTDTLFIKTTNLPSCEVRAMNVARAKTSIPIPRGRAVYGNDIFVVMDLVRNSRPLDQCWPSLSFWGKLKIILTMRHYIRQLLAISDPSRTATPGPLSIPPSACEGLVFDGEGYAGICPTIHALAEYFHKMHWKREHRTSKLRSPLKRGRLDDSLFSPPLVFTHNDLSMSNILLDNEGRLWLVDFEFAGFYPRWFEFVAMRFAAGMNPTPNSWQVATLFMAEPYLEVERWIMHVGEYSFYGAW